MRSCYPVSLELSSTLPFMQDSKLVSLTVTRSHPLKVERFAASPLSFYPHFLPQAVDGVMAVALCLQAVSQAPQHVRSFEAQATFFMVVFSSPIILLEHFP